MSLGTKFVPNDVSQVEWALKVRAGQEFAKNLPRTCFAHITTSSKLLLRWPATKYKVSQTPGRGIGIGISIGIVIGIRN